MLGLKRSLGAWVAISLVVVTSTWVGHTLEYLRIFGPTGVQRQLIGSIHAYMLPLAGLLELIAILLAGRFYRVWRGLGLRSERAEATLALAWRGAIPEASTSRLRRRRRVDLLPLWLLLAPVELALYVVQENVEATRVGLTAPGLAVLTGPHWPATFVHLAILLILCGVLAAAVGALVGRTRDVEEIERLTRLIAGRHGTQASAPVPAPVPLPSPIQLFGRQMWRRPPPLLPLSI